LVEDPSLVGCTGERTEHRLTLIDGNEQARWGRQRETGSSAACAYVEYGSSFWERLRGPCARGGWLGICDGGGRSSCKQVSRISPR
jgi:hypothetical protein